jgi:hypothetical protein
MRRKPLTEGKLLGVEERHRAFIARPDVVCVLPCRADPTAFVWLGDRKRFEGRSLREAIEQAMEWEENER